MTGAIRLALLLASAASVAMLAAPAAAREAEAPAPVRAQPGAPLMCQIVRPPARGEPDARLPVCAVPWADDDGRE